MNFYILIDSALPQAYLKLANCSGTIAESMITTPVNFWSTLDQLIQKTGKGLKELYFFINFGPGSYTGLKQSKILAEIFSGAGAKVHIFHQDQVLKAHAGQYKYFFSSAYKNQYYISEKLISGEIINKLVEKNDWEKWYLDHQGDSHMMVTVDSKIVESKNCVQLIDVYKELNYSNLNEISEKYNDQAITYYRAVTDDYQISTSR